MDSSTSASATTTPSPAASAHHGGPLRARGTRARGCRSQPPARKAGRPPPFAHRHSTDEEVYVVVAGSGRAIVEGDLVELRPWTALRVPAGSTRSFEADDEGLEFLAFDTHTEGTRANSWTPTGRADLCARSGRLSSVRCPRKPIRLGAVAAGRWLAAAPRRHGSGRDARTRRARSTRHRRPRALGSRQVVPSSGCGTPFAPAVRSAASRPSAEKARAL